MMLNTIDGIFFIGAIDVNVHNLSLNFDENIKQHNVQISRKIIFYLEKYYITPTDMQIFRNAQILVPL